MSNQKQKETISEFGRYAFSSVIVISINLGITYGCHEFLKLSEGNSFLIAQIISMIIAYLLMRYFVRCTTNKPFFKQFFEFLWTSIAFRGAEYLTFLAFIYFDLFYYLISVIIVKVFYFLIKFSFYKKYVF